MVGPVRQLLHQAIWIYRPKGFGRQLDYGRLSRSRRHMAIKCGLRKALGLLRSLRKAERQGPGICFRSGERLGCLNGRTEVFPMETRGQRNRLAFGNFQAEIGR